MINRQGVILAIAASCGIIVLALAIDNAQQRLADRKELVKIQHLHRSVAFGEKEQASQ